jgi:hypothetical protein
MKERNTTIRLRDLLSFAIAGARAAASAVVPVRAAAKPVDLR